MPRIDNSDTLFVCVLMLKRLLRCHSFARIDNLIRWHQRFTTTAVQWQRMATTTIVSQHSTITTTNQQLRDKVLCCVGDKTKLRGLKVKAATNRTAVHHATSYRTRR